MNSKVDQKDHLAREYSDLELFKRLLGYTKPHWFLFTAALLAMFLSTIL